jgi:hypothetical protein
MIREEIGTALTTAMKARDNERVATLRLMQAAIKNRDIEARTGGAPADDDVLVIEVLQKMAKQRRESIALFETGNRPELAAKEAAELAVIESYLPAAMGEDEAAAAIAALVREAGATGPKDMGAVMALVRERLSGRIDMGMASKLVKASLTA